MSLRRRDPNDEETERKRYRESQGRWNGGDEWEKVSCGRRGGSEGEKREQ